MILEKELEITTDPRAVYLNGDAVRILWDLGLREQLADLGHGITSFVRARDNALTCQVQLKLVSISIGQHSNRSPSTLST